MLTCTFSTAFRERTRKNLQSGFQARRQLIALVAQASMFRVNARILELSLKPSGELQKSDGQKSTFFRDIKKESRSSEAKKKHENREWKNPEAVLWGSAEPWGRFMYRKHSRCLKCGKKGWNDCFCLRDKRQSRNPKKRIMLHSSAALRDSCDSRLSALNVAYEENRMYDATYSGHPVRLVVK